MESLLQDIKYSVRLLFKKPGFTATAVVTLALGIGANTAIFSVVQGVLLSPLPFEDPEELAIIWRTNAERNTGNWPVPAPEFLDWSDQNDVFTATTAIRPQTFTVTGTEDPERITGAAVTSGYFDVLEARPIIGREFTADENVAGRETSAILSYGLWQRRYAGSESVLGETIELNGRMHTIVGVMPEDFAMPSTAELWTPVVFTEQQLSDRDFHFLLMLGRLRGGLTAEDGQRGLDVVSARLEQEYPETNTGWRSVVLPLHEQVVGGVRLTLVVMTAAVVFVLLISCANVANLITVRSASRSREMSIRAAMGASRMRLTRQVLMESVALSVAGGALGLVMAIWGVDALVAAAGNALPRSSNVSLNPMVLLFTGAISVLTGLVFGLLPAIQSSQVKVTDALKEGARGNGMGAGRKKLGSALVVLEMAVALVLVIGAGLMIKSFNRVTGIDTGYSVDNAMSFQVSLPTATYPDPQQVARFFDGLIERVEAVPGVVSAAAVPVLPITGGGAQIRYRVEGEPVGPIADMPVGRIRSISPGYFETMGMEVLEGRAFGDIDGPSGAGVAIVNEAFVRRHFDDGVALGKRMGTYREGDDPPLREIVGVVEDIRNAGLTNSPEPVYYLPQRQLPSNNMTIAVKAQSDPLALTPQFRELVRQMDPNMPLYNIQTFESQLANVVAAPRLRAQLLSTFASVALLLAAVGIYGVMAYSVSQRTQEMGVRMALGASPGEVRFMVVKEALKVVGGGVAIGLLAAFGLSRFISTLLYDVGASDPVTFAWVTAALTAVAVVSSYLPARRASRVDPIEALRYE